MIKKTLAFILALSLCLGSALALAETAAAPAAEDKVLATLNGAPITQSEAEAVMPQLANYMSDSTDYRYAVNFIIQQRILEQKIKDLGFDKFSEEEEAAFASEAQSQWDQGVQSYVSYYLSEDTEEARAQMKKQAEDFYAAQGFSVGLLAENIRQRASVDRLSDYLVGGYEPSDEEIQNAFQQYGAQYQQAYENDIMGYEYNTIFNQQPSWYTPEGYRGIIHILLTPDEDAKNEYDRLQSAFEEQQSALEGEPVDKVEGSATEAPEGTPAPTPEPVTQEQVDAALQAVLNSRKADLDAISERLQKGESFAALVKEFGQDPGMMDEQQLATGYSVHKDSIAWDPVFTAAAFSEKMQKVGDHSDPAVGSHGIHILHYLRDVPSGLVMTDEIRAELTAFLKTVKEGEAFNTAYADWLKENQVEMNEEAIQAAIDAAKPQDPENAQPEVEGLVAVPEGGAEEGAAPEETAAPAP